ncbi:hypothetical protein F442_21143 [Phytophthora nicotianae P10297]|uniref:Chromo domain-containing protein n=1 Tax=Phytophthora nicotianae P10297 TaxID=1317064 RepID=W2Y6E6_PHYNI|nr:hypothetical protein F442_21143 [Phytophthora nicotianae P10297]
MFTADHPQTDGQTERVNRVVEDILRSLCAEAPKRWSEILPLVEFALSNAVHASTGFTPFYVNGLVNPRVPLTLPRGGSGLGGGGIAERLADISPFAIRKQVDDFVSEGPSVHAKSSQEDAHPSGVYVGLLKPYQYPARVSAKSLAPNQQRAARPRSAAGQQVVKPRRGGRQQVVEPRGLGQQHVAKPRIAERNARDAGTSQAEDTAEQICAQGPGPGCESTIGSSNSPRGGTSFRDQPLRDERGRLRQGRMRCEDADAVLASADSQRGNPAEARPLPALLDEHGEPHYHVERLVARRRHRGRTQYLVKWRGYPLSQNSWEFEVPLREDFPDVVDAYDLAHPLPIRHMGLRLRREAPSASRQ